MADQLLLTEAENGAARSTTLPDSKTVDRFHVLMAWIAGSLALVVGIALRIESVSVAKLELVQFSVVPLIAICATAGYCHWAGNDRLRDGCLLIAWSSLFVNLLQLPSLVTARSGLPLVDPLLVKCDRFMGLDCAAVVTWTRAHPLVNLFSTVSYTFMQWLVAAAIFVTSLSGNLKRAKVLILATSISAIAASLVLTVMPAVGPWYGFNFRPFPEQATFMREFYALRASGPFSADPNYKGGLISFPSFHVALAVMAAYTLWPYRRLRWPAIVLAAMVVVSTVTTGWHYATDGIAGAALAVACIQLARKCIDGEHCAMKAGTAEKQCSGKHTTCG